ncbi:succinate/fumarate mitochondrial transporter [Ophiocordyceps sinensis CO18]|uniref:Succinate/fumarate mitochondrial transporter n=1 Tax=Ophiocordyceps sinensis (strain Co18 / CGMCC 3.14243) TaxID=911162 RepID=T5AKB7_OPHSC|nr:succinate/fumarate mitochondrial transporter [Ophiocordyceps sinensis CO18]
MPRTSDGNRKPPTAATNLIAGGGAGMMEALACHPLDTIKVRMQLSRRARQPGAPKRGFVRTGVEIVRKETPLGLYKGLGAVLTGIVPKMAIRFTSFESYKQLLADEATGAVSGRATFAAGLAAGPHSMADPLDIPKYRNAAHALYTVVREEGFGALYRGVSLTALRQGSNQAVNFTAYSYFKDALKRYQPQYDGANLPSWQTTIIGLVSGAMGPLSNAPIDTIQTRLQKTPAELGVSAWSRIARISSDMFKQEGFHAFYKGITPRIMRVAPGQAVTFTVYEYLKDHLERSNLSFTGAGKYEE